MEELKEKLNYILYRVDLKLGSIKFQKGELFPFDLENLEEIYNELKQLKNDL